MKFTAAFGASVVASVAYAQQSGPACNAISYDMSPFNGVLNYKTVTKYDWTMSGCSMQSTTAKSPIAPLDLGLTAVFRGPMQLKQFAVYNPAAGSSSKRSAKASPRARRHHNHEQFHKRLAEAEAEPEVEVVEGPKKRSCGDMVTATIDGQVQTFPDTWNCGAGSSAAGAATPAPAASSAAAPAVNVNAAVQPSSAAAASSAPAASSAAASSGSSSSSSSSGSSSSGGAWSQVAYYSSTSPSSSKNVTFLYPVPYANTDFLPSDGDCTGSPASSAQILSDVLVKDNERFYIASGDVMNPSPAPANKAYHGFAGSKIFLVEMGMPASGLRGQGQYPDMPAFWLLNEQLPATSDSAQCNCWASGCGEMDVHEILAPGATIGYSTLHMGQQYCGGASNGFARATSGTQKLAVIIDAGSSAANSVVRVVQLDNSYDFGSGISQSDYQSWVNMPIAGGQKGSLQTGSACPDPAGLSYKRSMH